MYFRKARCGHNIRTLLKPSLLITIATYKIVQQHNTEQLVKKLNNTKMLQVMRLSLNKTIEFELKNINLTEAKSMFFFENFTQE